MKIFDTMERTLQVGTPKERLGIPVRLVWPAEFRSPVDAALHVGTPPAQTKPIDVKKIGGPQFFD
ncbi:MAG: hypothetical protein NUV60_00460 [Patescibacteria group bacterium]|nr:hypothetical protein [Patescibacteria group bacterium]